MKPETFTVWRDGEFIGDRPTLQSAKQWAKRHATMCGQGGHLHAAPRTYFEIRDDTGERVICFAHVHKNVAAEWQTPNG